LDTIMVNAGQRNSNESLPILERLAHEVRQELHHVTASLEGASEDLLTEHQSTHLLRARTSVHRLLGTVNDLIALASPEPVAYCPLPLRTDDLVETFTGWFTARAKLRGLEFKCVMNADVPQRLVADRELTETVLYRILEHCIQTTAGSCITLLVAWSENQLVFHIIDPGGPGPGVSNAADVAIHESKTDELWFRVVHKRLLAAGGVLTIVSSPAQGATFRISIPASGMETSARFLHHEDKSQPMRILVAEDHDDSFLTFEFLVKGEGHSLVRARNGQEAVTMASQDQFDLVVMDVHMPVIDGYKATRLIREWETGQSRPRLPILLLSGEDPATLSRKGPSAGCSGFLNKPVRKQELVRALHYYGGCTSPVVQVH
jgi:CheY-like chemotaxis protein